ncbi:hypothetical protein UFOVP950_21 [uncultured Caudovirales phage]|uniref:Peptidase S74 domain-containing protein n=1 Tax=uncultured Caudovirales phage TaxID=2100421 RepID=A0A6J5PPP8_9CAUD|nr:hypothetical protein UFOVP950_21 [uncultured Caudovirales phage]
MPVINGVYLKDFPALPSAVTDANIIPIAISGNQIAYRTTVAGIVTDARVTSKLLTGLSVTGSTILATDTILQAFGKVQNQLNGKVSSVGLTMPAAFNVANSPITSAGTLAVTAAGLASQYIRGDGALADFPTTGGGGSSVSYYLNGSVSQGTIGGNAYYEMNKTPVIGTGTDFSIATDGYIAQFITDANDPASLLIPGGNWNVEMYFSASSSGGTPSFYVEVYKYDGSTFTLLGSSSATPEGITNGTAIDIYYTSVGIPETVLTITDRLAIRVYVTHSGRTITLHTEDNHLSEIVTTFSNGLTALNGLTKQTQYFATGTTGTDFNISSSVDTHTFNIPSASATARGLITTGSQTIVGFKTFNSGIEASRTTGNTIASTCSATGGLAFYGQSSGGASAQFDSGAAGEPSLRVKHTNSGPLQHWLNASAVVATMSNAGALTIAGQLSLGSTITNGTYTYTLPSATGTLALTSDIHSAVTLSAIGSTPNANAATLTGQVLNLEPASASFGGVVTTGTQTFAGDKTLTGSLYGIALSMTGTVGDIIASTATTGKAFRGTATTGYGVYATSTTGQAIYAESTGTGGSAINGTAANGIGGYFINNATSFATLIVTNSGSGNLAQFSNSAGTKFTINNAGNLGNGTYTYTLPSATGTLALTSALSSYLPLSGGTLTGALAFNSGFGTSTAAISIYNNTGASASNVALIDFRVNNSFGGNERVASITATNPNAAGNNGGSLLFAVSANGTSTTPTTALTIASTGAATFSSKVGVGGAAATYSLTAYNGANGTTAAFGGTARGLRIDNDGTFSSGRTTIFGVDNTFYGSYQPLAIGGSELYFSTAGTDRLTIASTGAATFTSNVTAGNTTVGAQVNVFASSYGNNGLFNAYGTDGNIKLQMGGLSNTNAFIYTGAGNSLSLFAGAAERLTIASTGAATFSSSVTATTGLTVGSLGSGSDAIITLANNASGSPRTIYYKASNASVNFTSTGAADLMMLSNGGVLTINNLGTGTVQATAGVLSVISDSKAKDKTGLFEGSAITAINKIQKPQYWNYNEKSQLGESTYSVKQFGLFADDIHEVLGEEFAPTQTQSVYDEETKETKVEPVLIDGSPSYSMSDRALLSLAIQAIQELKAEIDLLKGEPIIPTDNNLE